MKANSEKTKQSKKATRRVLAGVLCGASVLSLVLSLVMPPISQAIANDGQAGSTEETVMGGGSSSESADVDNTNNGGTENQNSDEIENGASEGTVAADSTADGAEVKGAEQPSDAQLSDNENSDENAIAPVSAEDYQDVQGDVASKFNGGGKYRLSGESWSDSQITITANTTIDLNGNMLYHRPGSVESFIVVQNNATLTIEDSGEDSGRVVDHPEPFTGEPGQPATMTCTGNNNGTPQSLIYYETTSTPNEDKLGTTETTTKHVVSGFGAIVAASDGGSVKRVISVADGSTLNLNGGMITTPRNLGNDGHVILSQGAVNISGGYVTNGNGGGWGGGLCITGANASLEMTGGVVAGNKAASGGGIFANNGATLELSGGVISGNATYDNGISDGYNVRAGGYGGGVYTQGAFVTISDSANITNNRAEARLVNKELYNKGLLGGGGIASHGGTLSMTGGSVTANYSHEAGGGIYAGLPGQGVGFTMSSGFIAGNMSDNAEGGGLRISGGTTGVINAENASNRVYITNNKTMTGSKDDRGGDWGGGGVFVQEGGTLNIVKTLITNNKAGGWGGGIGACPTGKTIVSHSKGAAIYDNKDNVDQYGNKLTAYHYSAGGHGKNEDHDEVNYVTPDFQKSGHKDFFLVRNKNGADKTIAVVLGKMLGGRSAGWRGTCDGNPVTIDPNGGAEAKWMFGLEANPTPYAKGKAQAEATTIISGNYSYTHGGGIMTNGDLIVGEVNDLRVYPSMKLHATKALVDAQGDKQSLNGHEYKFQLLRQEVNGTKAPSWKDDGTLDMGDCSGAGEATVDQSSGSITFDSGKDYSSGQYVFYLVEEPISGQNELDIKFDKTIYKIEVTVGGSPYKTESLMTFPINYYKVESVAVFKKAETDNDFAQLDRSGYSFAPSEDGTEATVTIGNRSDNPTFINKIVPPFSWTPKATKVVEGGEMKAFTLQLAKDSEFKNMIGTAVTSGSEKTQTLPFMDENNETVELKYSLSDIRNNPDDPGGSTGGSFKTFTYYVREKTDGSQFSHYTYDHSVYKFTVEPTYDDKKGEIKCRVTYRKGTVDPGGTWKNTDNVDHEFPDTNPTFTNTYSTSLPLSGMSGVTLTYLAGAAVLCAAAAWMHIRRKANAKGGKRRE